MYKIFVKTDFIGSKLIFLPKCHSTNDIANELIAREEIGHGEIVITNHQLKGRGQRGNTWHSDAGQNLTFSLVLMPERLNPSDNFYLNILASLACMKTCEENLTSTVKIKWPNDIMVGDKKIGGILIENNIMGTSISQAIIGIGLNINQRNFPNPINATSLLGMTGHEFELNLVMNGIIQQFDRYYGLLWRGSYKELKDEYLDNLYWKDQPHLFRSGKDFTGYIRGIDEVGRLVIETNDGLRSFIHKEVSYLI